MLPIRPGGGVDLGPQRVHRPQQLAVLGQFGLTAQAPLDVATLGPVEAAGAVDHARQGFDDLVTRHEHVLPPHRS